MALPLWLKHTSIDSGKTAGQICDLLARAGAQGVMLRYGPDRRVVGIDFAVGNNGALRKYRLPVRPESVFARLNGDRKQPGRRERMAEEDRIQAERIAWRQAYRWCEAQLALMETGMVDAAEVFLPYLATRDGRTAYEILSSTNYKALPVMSDE